MTENKVDVKVREIKRRTASFKVDLGAKAVMSAAVNTKSITFGYTSDIPKTIEAADAIIALAQAVRAELVEQGIEEFKVEEAR